MSNKNEVETLRKKFFDKKKELQVEQANQEIAKGLTNIAYTIIEDPDKTGRHFLIIKIKFDIVSRTSIIEGVRSFQDKAAGLAFVMNTNNLEFLYNKNKEK